MKGDFRHVYCVSQSGPDERSIPGNTVAVQADMPFSGLTTFGTAFLSKFECSQMPHPVCLTINIMLLKEIVIVFSCIDMLVIVDPFIFV